MLQTAQIQHDLPAARVKGETTARMIIIEHIEEDSQVI
jgi:hypothetical protein